MTMFERFTAASRDVIVRAMGEAVALDSAAIGTGHMLLALLDERAGPAAASLRAAGLSHDQVRDLVRRRLPLLFDDEDAKALESVGVNLNAVLTRIAESFGPDALAGHGRGSRIRLDAEAKTALRHALRETIARQDRRIEPQHLLLGLLAAECAATLVLADAGVDSDGLRADLVATLGKAA
jgi:ATP-dependent Clp protease ATP-binding subunit ClpA